MTPFVAALARHRARTTLAVGALSWQDLGRAVDERAKELLAGGERVLVAEQPRGAAWVVELLAAHTVGAAFVPLDPSAPAIYRRALRERIAAAPREVLTGLAWVVFTSGSTGRPKQNYPAA